MANRFASSSPELRRPPKMLSWIVTAIFVIGALLPTFIGVYTDWLWFGEVNFRGVFNKVILTRIALFFFFALITTVITWLAGWLTYRTRPKTMDLFESDNPIVQYRRIVERSLRTFLYGLPIVIGVIAGFLGQRSWQTVQLFLNRQDFGMNDPQFGMDYGFYAFSLPMIQIMIGMLSTAVTIGFFITLIGHYLLGSIRIGNRTAGVTGGIAAPARIQLALWAGAWMLLRALNYWFERYDLLNNRHDTFTGGSYTDINAVLPARIILLVISVVVAVCFFTTVVLKDLRIPAAATVLMLLSSVTIGAVWPMMMERFSVSPNRAEKESEYIARNIEATRYGYGITDSTVTYLDNWGAEGASNSAVAADVATINNIRLLDPEVLSKTFTQQQQLKNFYGFPDSLAMDRYEIDGELRDFVVAAREINPNALRDNQRDWINRHTVYTHGNGFVAAQANQVDEVARDVGSARGGYPVYTVSDLETLRNAQTNEDVEKLGIEATEPRIYYGPLIASTTDGRDYAVVGANDGNSVEYDTDTSTYTYQGQGGVNIGNLFNQVAFAAKYGEMNLILSERVNSESKILFDRDPRQRVHKVAPWLTTDGTTYPAVIDGHIKWIVDGYTTLDSLPYSTRVSLSQVTNDTSAQVGAGAQFALDEVGYIRNSVKAVVDAYDGTVELYEFDENDPVLKAWQGVFPNTVKPKSEIAEELMNHIRYPEDIFKVQRQMLTRYHVEDPREFFTNDRFWSVPADPSAPEGTLREASQPPFYVVAASPETGEASFQLITPFRGLSRDYLAAHMSASSDPDKYGHITVRVLPTNTTTQGPRQAQDAMMSSDTIAADITLWQNTNKLTNGNLLTLPVGGGEILYVEPLYSQRKDQESAFPKLLRVLVSYKGQVGYAPTISEALSQVGIDPSAAQDLKDAVDLDTTPKDNNAPAQPSAPASGSGTEGEAIKRINDALTGLEKARSGSHEEYGRALDALDKAVADYQSLNSQANS
ncbi:UPF0182 family protein [Corynebacterium kutscheri]|nr:UPF0182 family protein [Corynebacterium kutscheri]